MRISDLKSHDAVRQERRAKDPDYAAEADRLELANEVSVTVVAYRVEHGLSQAALGEALGWKQPQVARLERGDVPPRLETLQRLAHAGILEVHVEQRGTRVGQLATA